jgi:RNA-directed DNA polymerase
LVLYLDTSSNICLLLKCIIRIDNSDCISLFYQSSHFVCREASQAREAMREVQSILDRLMLTLHPEKTKIVKTRDEGFDFLGFHFQKFASRKSGKLLPFNGPCRKAMNRIRERIRDEVNIHRLKDGLPEMVAQLNMSIRGWRNYFQNSNATKELQQLESHVYKRFERVFRPKYKDAVLCKPS